MFFRVITTIAVTVAVLAAPTPDPRGASTGMAIPLSKHSSLLNPDKRINIDALKSYVASHSAKIIRGMSSFERNMGTPHTFAVERDRSGAGIDLTNYIHEIWYGIISIGTPAKSFTVQFDTGSGDLFVPASTGDENCRSHANLWDPTSPQSSAKALNQDFSLEFKDDAIVKGEVYTDNVTIAGFTADVQIVGAATTYSPIMKASSFVPDGLLGLAFAGSLSTDNVGKSPLLLTLFDEGKLPQPMFSIMLTASGGELYIGGMNEALYHASSLTFTPVTSPDYWQLNIDNIKVNNKIVRTNVPAVIDTGCPIIFGDPLRVLALHKAGGGEAFEGGLYTFPCSSFPSVTFTIGGKSILIPANVLNQGQVEDGSSDCSSGIMAEYGTVRFWTLGAIFLQMVYTVFDFGSELEPPRVGFASLINPEPHINMVSHQRVV